MNIAIGTVCFLVYPADEPFVGRLCTVVGPKQPYTGTTINGTKSSGDFYPILLEGSPIVHLITGEVSRN